MTALWVIIAWIVLCLVFVMLVAYGQEEDDDDRW